MLKTLKWVYALGKKNEEQRLYHALREQVRVRQQAPDYYSQTDEERKKYKQRQEEVEHGMYEIIQKVFFPIEEYPVEIKSRNRFDEVDA